MLEFRRFHGILSSVHHFYNSLIVDNISPFAHLIDRRISYISRLVACGSADVLGLCGGYLAVGYVFEGLSGSFCSRKNFLLTWSVEVDFACIRALTQGNKILV